MGERDNLDNLPVLDGEIVPDDAELGRLIMVSGSYCPPAPLQFEALERIGLFDGRDDMGIKITFESSPKLDFSCIVKVRDEVLLEPIRHQEHQWPHDRFGRKHRGRKRRK